MDGNTRFSLLILLVSFPYLKSQELQAKPYLTRQTSLFGSNIEGASVNKKGHIFATNFNGNLNQAGQVYPKQQVFFSESITSSYLNGIRFLDETTAFTADVTNHRVLKLTVDPVTSSVTHSEVFCSDPAMLQPNDLVISASGTVFTSGMQWLSDTDDRNGDIWSCTPEGKVQRLAVMGRTNGIELSPDETKLYVSESYNRGGTPYAQRIWRYDVDTKQGTISNKKLFVDFEKLDGSVTADIDGMKTDVNGNLYVTRHGAKRVTILSPTGAFVNNIRLNFPNPTNLEFGGDAGKELFIVGGGDGCVGCADHIKLSTPGRAWTMLQKN